MSKNLIYGGVDMIKNIKTINGFLYILFQTDQWKTYNSRVCFGVYDSYEHANAEAERYDLKTCISDYEIVATKINQFAEV